MNSSAEHHTGWLAARKQAERTTFILQKSRKLLPVNPSAVFSQSGRTPLCSIF
jgi:hypothetical protein